MAGVRRIFGATALNGGTGALSNIDSTSIAYGDLAIAQADSLNAGVGHGAEFDGIYFYRYANVTDTPDTTPKVVKPNNLTSGQSGRWLLISPAYFMEDLTVEAGAKVIVNEIISNDNDLTLAYNDGSVYITIGDNLITVDAPTTFTQQIVSGVLPGTAPIVVASTTECTNLNAQYVGGEPITNISILDDNTQLYTILPRVEPPVDEFAPTYPQHDDDIATKKYVDDELSQSPSDISHSSLLDLDVDADHLQYSLVSGTRAFTGEVSGVDPTVLTSLATAQYVQDEIASKATDVHIRHDGTVAFSSVTNMPSVVNAVTQVPTLDEHLTTMKYVDDAVQANSDHNGLSNLDVGDVHTQYVHSAGTTPFTGVVSGVTPTGSTHLTTKGYVDGITDGIIGNYIVKDGSIAFTGKPKITVLPLDPLGVLLTPGSGYTNNTNVATLGGTGIGLTVDTTTDGNEVLSVIISITGSGYTVGDVVSIVDGDGFATFTITDGTPSFIPDEPWELATVEFVEGLAAGGNHDDTLGAADSVIHNKFPLLDGTRPLTGLPKVTDTAGVPDYAPILAYELTTKAYVDGSHLSSHTALDDLVVSDDHTQYIHVDGRRVFDTNIAGNWPSVSNNGTTPDGVPSALFHLTTKSYVDGKLTDLGALELVSYVDIWGRHDIVSNQLYTPQNNQHFLSDVTQSELANIDYITNYTMKFLLSETDEFFDFFESKLEFSDSFTETVIDAGTNTGMLVEKTTERLEGIDRIEITNGGTGFFVIDYESANPLSPVTFSGLYRADGVAPGTYSLTETVVFPDSDTGVDANMVVAQVVGDVEYMEIVNDGGNALTALKDNWYSFEIVGTGYQTATWEVLVTNGGPEVLDDPITDGYISDVKRDTTSANLGVGLGYSGNLILPIGGILGITGTFELQPYVTGEITNIEINTIGTGYDEVSYNLTEATKDAPFPFTYSGEGTANLGTLNVTFHNPVNEKLKLSHYNPDTSVVDELPDYTSGYIRTSGQVISSLTFDEWGHITGITEAGTGGQSWVHHLESVDGATITAVGDNSYWVYPDGGPVTVNLPAVPVSGTVIVIDDYRGNSLTNNITVSPDASDYMEGVLADDVIIDVDGSSVAFTFLTDVNDTTFGWRYKVI